MSLVGPWLSTTSTKKHKARKYTKAELAEFQQGWRDRNEWLKNLHLPKQTFEEYMEWIYGRGKKEKKKTSNKHEDSKTLSKIRNIPKQTCQDNNRCSDNDVQNTGNLGKRIAPWITGPCTTKQTPTYTGTKIIGISQMAKSNSVPVFSQDEIIDIARMRR